MPTASFGLCLTAVAVLASASDRENRLTMQVSPAAAMAPAAVTVRTNVAANPDNRLLEIVVESPDFFRSSQIPLDGDHGPRLNVVLLKGLPKGLYEIRATLVGTGGPRAQALGLVAVAASSGR